MKCIYKYIGLYNFVLLSKFITATKSMKIFLRLYYNSQIVRGREKVLRQKFF